MILLGLLTAGSFRGLALYTVPEYLEKRYRSRLIRILGAVLSAAALLGITASQIQVAGGAGSLLGLDPEIASILAALFFVSYTVLGGLWAVAVTDLVQILVGGAGMALACVLVLQRTMEQGGLLTLLKDRLSEGELTSTFTQLGGEGFGFVLWLSVPTVMYTLIGQDFYQRLFAARDSKVARQGALIAGAALIPLSFVPVLIGMGAKGLGVSLGDASGVSVLFDVILQMMPGLAGGIVLAAFLAAIMSSADSLLAAAASHLVKDIRLASLVKRNPDDETELRVSRWVTALAGLVALLIALGSREVFTTILTSYILYTAGVFVAVLGGVLWKGATRQGALASILLGTAAAVYGIVTGHSFGGVPTEVLAAGVSAAAFIVVSLMTRKV